MRMQPLWESLHLRLSRFGLGLLLLETAVDDKLRRVRLDGLHSWRRLLLRLHLCVRADGTIRSAMPHRAAVCSHTGYRCVRASKTDDAIA